MSGNGRQADEPERKPNEAILEGLRALTNAEGLYRLDLGRLLDGKLRDLRDFWGIDTSNGTIAARYTIRAFLVGYFAQIGRPTPREAEKAAERETKFEQCYYVGFNLEAPKTGLEEVKLGERQQWLDDNYSISLSMSYRDISFAIGEIERLIARGYKPPVDVAKTDAAGIGDNTEGVAEALIASDHKPPSPAPAPIVLTKTSSQTPPPSACNQPGDSGTRVAPATKPRNRRSQVLIGLAATVVAVVAVAGTVYAIEGFSTPSGGSTVSGTTSTPKATSPETIPPPQPKILEIAQPTYVPDVNQGLSFAFEHPPRLTAQDLAEANKVQSNWKGLFDWAQPHHGVIVTADVIQVTISNPQSGTAVITDMELVEKQCRAPLSGGLMYSPPAASNRDTQMLFDLDTPETEPHLYQEHNDSGRYFTGPDAQYITVPHDTPQVILMHAVTRKFDCKFEVGIDVTAADGTKGHYVISDGGKPFEVTAIPDNPNTGVRDFTGYKELYAGGVASPHVYDGVDSFDTVDPKTFQG